MATGRTFDFDEAERLGIVDRQIEAASEAEFLERVFEYAGQFLRPGRSSTAVGHIKRAVQTGVELPLEAGLALERELQQRLFTSEDAKEGIRAFTAKRPPHFRGQ
jgi:enoyl-CoA hydratase/carnithine racemase